MYLIGTIVWKIFIIVLELLVGPELQLEAQTLITPEIDNACDSDGDGNATLMILMTIMTAMMMSWMLSHLTNLSG